MSSTVTITPYSDKNVLVQGDYDTHAKQMKYFHARWNPRLKNGPGWLVPVDQESLLRAHFNVEDEHEDVNVSRKYKPAPTPVKASKKKLVEEVVEEEEVTSEEEREEEPEEVPLQKKPLVKKQVAKPPSSKNVSSHPVSSHPVSSQDDIISLSRKMSEMMSRLEHLEKKTHR